MSYKLKINVTKEILERSKMCGFGELDCVTENCAIALAVRDLFKEAKVGSEVVWYDFHTDFHSILPLEAREFIKRFDGLRNSPEKRADLDPISFEIEVPDEIIEEIGIQEVKEILEISTTMELVYA